MRSKNTSVRPKMATENLDHNGHEALNRCIPMPPMSSAESSDDPPLSKQEKTKRRMDEIKATIAENLRRNGFTNEAFTERFFREHPGFDLSIGDLDVEPRTVKVLDKYLGIIRVLELLHCPREELLAVPGIGKTAIDHIFDALRAKNIIRPTAQPSSVSPKSDNGKKPDDKPVSADCYPPSVQTLLLKLEAITHGDGMPRSNEKKAEDISILSRAIRSRLGPPWENDPALVDSAAEHLSTAVASIEGLQESPDIQRYVIDTLQRMIFILDDKRGESSKSWWRKLNALLENEQKAPAA